MARRSCSCLQETCIAGRSGAGTAHGCALPCVERCSRCADAWAQGKPSREQEGAALRRGLPSASCCSIAVAACCRLERKHLGAVVGSFYREAERATHPAARAARHARAARLGSAAHRCRHRVPAAAPRPEAYDARCVQGGCRAAACYVGLPTTVHLQLQRCSTTAERAVRRTSASDSACSRTKQGAERGAADEHELFRVGASAERQTQRRCRCCIYPAAALGDPRRRLPQSELEDSAKACCGAAA
jgi:hypothetical protein